MGLHICYELRLPLTTPDEDAMRLLERLRSYVGTLSVDTVTDLTQLSGTELLRDDDCFDRWSVPWLVHITARGVWEERHGTAGAINEVDRLAAAAFLMHPGHGSEAALFGLVRAVAVRPSGGRRTRGRGQQLVLALLL